MKNDVFDSVKQVVKYWWLSLLVGLLAIMLGIWSFANPETALLTLSLIFAVNFIIMGVFEIVFSIFNRQSLNGWGWSLTSGIIDLIFGLLLFSLPLASIIVLMFFVGFWILFQSVWGIGAAMDLRRYKAKGWGWILILSLVGLILAFMLITNPLFAGTFLAVLFSISLVSYGLQRIIYGFNLRALHKRYKED